LRASETGAQIARVRVHDTRAPRIVVERDEDLATCRVRRRAGTYERRIRL
jgi:hypothetical protein